MHTPTKTDTDETTQVQTGTLESRHGGGPGALKRSGRASHCEPRPLRGRGCRSQRRRRRAAPSLAHLLRAKNPGRPARGGVNSRKQIKAGIGFFAETGIPDHVAPHNNVGSPRPDPGGRGRYLRTFPEKYGGEIRAGTPHGNATGDAFASHPSRSTSSCACVVLRTNLYTAYFAHNIVCLHAIRWIHGSPTSNRTT